MKGLLLLLLTSQLVTTGLTISQPDPNKEYDEREYLGSVKNAQGQQVYHLVNHTYAVQAAVVAHGHLELLVYNQKWRLVEKYVVDNPDGLPVLLRRNMLYFRTRGAKGEMIRHRQLINPVA